MGDAVFVKDDESGFLLVNIAYVIWMDLKSWNNRQTLLKISLDEMKCFFRTIDPNSKFLDGIEEY